MYPQFGNSINYETWRYIEDILICKNYYFLLPEFNQQRVFQINHIKKSIIKRVEHLYNNNYKGSN